jgi:hypothetical protein
VSLQSIPRESPRGRRPHPTLPFPLSPPPIRSSPISAAHHLTSSRELAPLKMPLACQESSASTRSSPEERHQKRKPKDSLADTKLDTSARIRLRCVSNPGYSVEMGFIEANVASALVHVIVGLMLLGYSQEYYFHLSTTPVLLRRVHVLTESRTSQEQCALEDEDGRDT